MKRDGGFWLKRMERLKTEENGKRVCPIQTNKSEHAGVTSTINVQFSSR